MSFSLRLPRSLVLLSSVVVLATSCTSHQILQPATVHLNVSGKVYGGEQPITGAAIYLYKVNTSTNGGASTNILSGYTVTTSDGTSQVNSNANTGNQNNQFPAGDFTITGDYTCTAGTMLYIAAVGGNTGNGINNSQENLDALGDCANLTASTSVFINEVTTVGTVAGLRNYMTAYDHVGSSSSSAMTSAFNTAAEYINSGTAAAPGPALPSGYYASSNDVRALANAVQACVNSDGNTGVGHRCGSLFAAAQGTAASPPTETVGALIDILADPTNNVGTIFNLQGTTPAFMPTNSSAPVDWTLPILQIPGTPVISPVGGTYASTQSVTIADADATANLYYTTDGSTPSASSTAYTGAISVSATETISAIAIESSRLTSSVASTSYTINTALTAPTASLASLSTSYGSTTGITLTATSNASGSVVTFGTAGSIGGSFSNSGTCTISGTTCSMTYTPSGTLAVGTYANDLTANFGATGTYGAANATGTVTILANYSNHILHTFTAATISGTSQTDGQSGANGLVQGTDGYFYGMSIGGGASAGGTLFKVSADGSVYKQLHAFTGAAISGTSQTDGKNTYGALIEGFDGYFYGVTQHGGAANAGTVFKISADGSTYTQLYAFTGAAISGTSQTDGSTPDYASLIQGGDGTLYGTTDAGGANSHGTIFKISPTGTNYTQLYAFTDATISGTSQTDGASPDGGVVMGADGYLYGTTFSGGSNSAGTVFKISTTGTGYTQLHSFTATTIPGTSPTQKDGATVYGTVMQGSDGYIYGTSYAGGNSNLGTVWKVSTDGTVFKQLHAFTGATIAGTTLKDGTKPYTPILLLGSDGYLYGMAEQGGAGGYGTIIQMSNDGTVYNELYAFTGATISGTSTTDGKYPNGFLVQGSDGNFYSETNAGGASSVGVVFKFTASPALAAPVVISAPSSVAASSSFTLSYSVANAYVTGGTAGTMSQCFAGVLNSANVYTLLGTFTGSPATQTTSLTAPGTTGTYTLSVTCGGLETTSTTLTVQ